MSKEIYYVRRATDIKEIEGLNFFDRRKKPEKLIKKLTKKCPITIKKNNVNSISTTEIILPIITNIKMTLNEEYIISSIYKFNEWCKNNIHGPLIIYSFFDKYKQYFLNPIVEKEYLNILYIRNIVERLIAEECIGQENVTVTLIGESVDITKYVIASLINTVNYFRIITNKEQDYAGFALEIYNKYGVLLDVNAHSNLDIYEADLVIDCSKEPNKNFYKIKKDSYVLYTLLDDENVIRNATKRVDLNFVHQIKVDCESFIDNHVFLWTLMDENKKINRLVSRFISNDNFENVKAYLDGFKVSISFDILSL